MKPHEETWTFEPSVSNDCYVVDGDGSIVAEVEDVSYVSLISASPDMARDLLLDLEEHGGSYASDPCRCQRCERKRGTLRKAGVFP